MTSPRIEVCQGSVKRQFPLREGLRAGEGLEVPIEGAAGDELHFQASPPSVTLVGSRTTPLLNGRVFTQARLGEGDAIQWCGAVLVLSGASALLEELPPVEEPPPQELDADDYDALERVGARVTAGLLVELGLASGAVARRWQDAVRGGDFDPDACADELLDSSAAEFDDPRLLERSARLQRDLVMAPLQRGARGATRKARVAARGGLAMFLAQGLALGVFTLLLLAVLLLLRVKHDYSVDRLLDSLLDTVTPGLILLGGVDGFR